MHTLRSTEKEETSCVQDVSKKVHPLINKISLYDGEKFIISIFDFRVVNNILSPWLHDTLYPDLHKENLLNPRTHKNRPGTGLSSPDPQI